MDDLRLVLLFAGAGIIVGIYFWDRLQSRRLTRRDIVRSMTAPDDEPDLVITAGKDTDEDLSSELANLNSFLNASAHDQDTGPGSGPGSAVTIRPVTNQESRQTDTTDPAGEATGVDPDSVITLYLVSAGTESFTGRQIMEVLPALGFRFGEMDIFHYYGTGQAIAEKPLFSLANMYEPGSFTIREMESFSTRGLLLFTCLPTATDSCKVFDRMLEIARMLAGKLDAEILGTGRRPLDEQTINHMKQHVREYGRL